MNDSSAELPLPLLDAARQARIEFLSALEPLRPRLHRYCRKLTGDLWDAEDLVQETLARAFAHAAQSHQPVERPMAWLARIATNAYVDDLRRAKAVPAELPEQQAPAGADPLEVRDALTEVSRLLPPQERACILLKDVFDLSLKEIAALLSTSDGAVKAALHRGRARLEDPDRQAALALRPAPDPAVLDQLADAFTAYDLDRLAALFLPDAVSEVVGVVHEVGAEAIRSGSLHHTLRLETDVRYRAEVRDVADEAVVLLWATPTDASAAEMPAAEALADVLRVETADGAIARLRWCFFCPETLTEVADLIGAPVRTHGYHY